MKYKKLNKISGAALILLLIWLVILIGMAALVIDIGQLRLAKSKAQNAADASAIAAAYELDGTDNSLIPAQTKAKNFGVANNISLNNVIPCVYPDIATPCIAEEYDNTEKLGEYQSAKVRCKVKVDYTFVPIFSMLYKLLTPNNSSNLDDSGTVTASATAMWTSATKSGPKNLMPWVLPQTQLWGDSGEITGAVGQEFTLKLNDSTGSFTGTGNFQCVDFGDDHGGNDYRNRIAGDPSVIAEIVNVGQVLPPENGNMVGPTKQGLDTRLKNSAFPPAKAPDYIDPFITWKAAGYPIDSRVVLVPVAQFPLPANGDIEVVGFAAFFICKASPDGEVTGHFVTARLDGDTLSYGGTNFSKPGDTTLVSSVRLVK